LVFIFVYAGQQPVGHIPCYAINLPFGIWDLLLKI